MTCEYETKSVGVTAPQQEAVLVFVPVGDVDIVGTVLDDSDNVPDCVMVVGEYTIGGVDSVRDAGIEAEHTIGVALHTAGRGEHLVEGVQQ